MPISPTVWGKALAHSHSTISLNIFKPCLNIKFLYFTRISQLRVHFSFLLEVMKFKGFYKVAAIKRTYVLYFFKNFTVLSYIRFACKMTCYECDPSAFLLQTNINEGRGTKMFQKLNLFSFLRNNNLFFSQKKISLLLWKFKFYHFYI